MAATAGALAICPGTLSAAENPFAHFTGNWTGTGKITVQNGSSERIRCRGTYRAGETGGNLGLVLTCASDSYKFELQSDITYDGGSISGSWNEKSRQIYGQLSGRATPNSIQATAQTVGFTAQISIATRGNSQSVSIRSPGSEISEVSIALARR
jgi:hypothetical protein